MFLPQSERLQIASVPAAVYNKALGGLTSSKSIELEVPDNNSGNPPSSSTRPGMEVARFTRVAMAYHDGHIAATPLFRHAPELGNVVTISMENPSDENPRPRIDIVGARFHPNSSVFPDYYINTIVRATELEAVTQSVHRGTLSIEAPRPGEATAAVTKLHIPPAEIAPYTSVQDTINPDEEPQEEQEVEVADAEPKNIDKDRQIAILIASIVDNACDIDPPFFRKRFKVYRTFNI